MIFCMQRDKECRQPGTASRWCWGTDDAVHTRSSRGRRVFDSDKTSRGSSIEFVLVWTLRFVVQMVCPMTHYFWSSKVLRVLMSLSILTVDLSSVFFACTLLYRQPANGVF
jgi:hypothetical protein